MFLKNYVYLIIIIHQDIEQNIRTNYIVCKRNKKVMGKVNFQEVRQCFRNLLINKHFLDRFSRLLSPFSHTFPHYQSYINNGKQSINKKKTQVWMS